MAIFDMPPLSRKVRAMRRVFSAIHTTRAWGDGESASGQGSSLERAASFLPDLIALVKTLQVSVLLDAPCGDFHWTAPLADICKDYVGVDVVPALIKANQQRWSSPRRRFVCADMVNQRLPAADLVFCRDGLVHLCTADIGRALQNFARSGARYLITTTFIGDRDNIDIANGDWRPLNLQRAPFHFPPALALVDERCHHTGGIYADKRFGLWRIADLPGSTA